MPRLLIISVLLIAASPQLFASCFANGKAIQLLPGYTANAETSVDALACTISKTGGITISFEMGPTQGIAAAENRKEMYSLYRSQVIRATTFKIAIIKEGLSTPYEPEDVGSSEPRGNILLVSVPLDPKIPQMLQTLSPKSAVNRILPTRS
jgi:hypothetical protein